MSRVGRNAGSETTCNRLPQTRAHQRLRSSVRVRPRTTRDRRLEVGKGYTANRKHGGRRSANPQRSQIDMIQEAADSGEYRSHFGRPVQKTAEITTHR